MVHGNCQAESLRLGLDGPDLSTVRIPPVHELEPDDLPHLERILARVSVLVSQPVRDGYHDMALGHHELAARLGPGGRVVRVPVIRFAGLYPTQAIIRPASDPAAVPPVVPYHDLRILVRAAGSDALVTLTPDTVREVAAASIAELARRERGHDTVPVSDLFARPGFAQMRTVNHPGNAIWEALAGRVRDRLGLDAPVGLTRPLLDRIHAPREPAVIAAFGLDVAPEPCWRVDDEAIDPHEVEAAHLAWYRRHPEAVTEGLRRHAPVLQLLTRR